MSESVKSKKCFTFTWTIENISYYWHKTDECMRSPTFVIKALQEWKYFLALTPIALVDDDDISFRLHVEGNQEFSEIGGELALLSKDGSVLTSQKFENDKNSVGFIAFQERKVFLLNMSTYLPEDKLTARCRIWKRAGEMVEDIQCFARTRIGIEKEAFLWDIQNFSRFQSEEISTYQIKSVFDNEVWMTLNLFLKNLFSDWGSINIQLTSENAGFKITAPTGTIFKFKPPTGTIKFHPRTGTDAEKKIGIQLQCITCMQEYENESLEELRFGYYTANREESSTTGGKEFGAPTLQTTIFSTSTTSTSDFHTTSTKEFSAEFGMNSSRPPSTYPWFEGTLAKTATATSGLSSNNIPSQNKGFNFETTFKWEQQRRRTF